MDNLSDTEVTFVKVLISNLCLKGNVNTLLKTCSGLSCRTSSCFRRLLLRFLLFLGLCLGNLSLGNLFYFLFYLFPVLSLKESLGVCHHLVPGGVKPEVGKGSKISFRSGKLL